MHLTSQPKNKVASEQPAVQANSLIPPATTLQGRVSKMNLQKLVFHIELLYGFNALTLAIWLAVGHSTCWKNCLGQRKLFAPVIVESASLNAKEGGGGTGNRQARAKVVKELHRRVFCQARRMVSRFRLPIMRHFRPQIASAGHRSFRQPYVLIPSLM